MQSACPVSIQRDKGSALALKAIIPAELPSLSPLWENRNAGSRGAVGGEPQDSCAPPSSAPQHFSLTLPVWATSSQEEKARPKGGPGREQGPCGRRRKGSNHKPPSWPKHIGPLEQG